MMSLMFISLLSVAFAQDLYPCEGGVFIPDQFETGGWAGDVEQPLEQIGVDLTLSEDACLTFPDSGECPDALYVAGEAYFTNFSLSDPHPDNPERSYGDMWCEILAASIQGNNKEIASQFPVVYGRIFGCGNEAGEWDNTVAFATHNEYFCCDSDGDYNEISGCDPPILRLINRHTDTDSVW